MSDDDTLDKNYNDVIVNYNYSNKNEKIKHSKPIILSENKELAEFYRSKVIDYDYLISNQQNDDNEQQLLKAENMIDRLQELNIQMSSLMDQLLLENYELRKRLGDSTPNSSLSNISDEVTSDNASYIDTSDSKEHEDDAKFKYTSDTLSVNENYTTNNNNIIKAKKPSVKKTSAKKTSAKPSTKKTSAKKTSIKKTIANPSTKKTSAKTNK